ncbi:MAG: HhH-GPD-type base excision DNA repair protein [Gaiellales bacterium]
MPAPALLPWTGDAEADRLLAADPNALLIGFALDQQVTVQKAFAGPAVLRARLGHLDPARIAALDADAFLAVCREQPAIHRFPGTMAARVQDLCHVIAAEYGGDGSRVWREATSGDDLAARLGALPGIGPLKVTSLLVLLARQYGVDLPGLAALLPDHPTLGEVATAEQLAAYQAGKRAAKAAKRAAAE